MKHTFKPLALAAAVAAVSAGVSAQGFDSGIVPSMGAAAIVPYYTVQEGWVTGVHIINSSSELTQVVKLRLRRAEDSKDVLDFNIVLSPNDEWTGTLRGDDAAMEWVTDDKSCTAPALIGGTQAPLRPENLDGAQEGYIEVIGMAAAVDTQGISKSALHVDGVPVNCDSVRTNFLVSNVLDNDTTVQTGKNAGTNVYIPTPDSLKVSYFIRDNDSGSEFGGNGTHFFFFNLGYPMMTHQQYGVESFATKGVDALNGWDFPDARGGGNNTGDYTTRNSWAIVRAQLGANELLNDWSYNPATGATTDWTVNFLAQYSMVDVYQLALAGVDPTATWDYREIPVVATFSVYDREENEGIPGGLDFSPSPAPDAALLPYEVNVITWGPDGATNNVLGSEYAINVDPSAAGIESPTGWASLSVEGTVKRERVQQGVGNPVPFAVCDTAGGPGQINGYSNNDEAVCISVSGPVPMVGFTAWDRTFDDPDLSYGRIVDHSFTSSFL